MTLLEIFERVNMVIPIEQRRFFNHFNDTVAELNAQYDGFVLEAGIENYTPVHSLSDSVQVLPLYHTAIVDNILFLMNGEETYKGEFMRKADTAHKNYWRDNAKGKRLKRMRW